MQWPSLIHFYPEVQLFPKQSSIFESQLFFLPAKFFILEWSKILSFGKGLNIYHRDPLSNLFVFAGYARVNHNIFTTLNSLSLLLSVKKILKQWRTTNLLLLSTIAVRSAINSLPNDKILDRSRLKAIYEIIF